MSKLNKQTNDEMIKYIECLLKDGIYCYGTKMPFSINRIARHLVANGCRIHIGSRKRKWLNKKITNNIKDIN